MRWGGQVVVLGESAMLTDQRLDGVPEAAALCDLGFVAEQKRQILLMAGETDWLLGW